VVSWLACLLVARPLFKPHLWVVCILQAVPVAEQALMTQMGLFTMSGYRTALSCSGAQSDSVYSSRIGRRKSWIIPVQLASASLLIVSAGWIQQQYELGAVLPLTILFFFLCCWPPPK